MKLRKVMFKKWVPRELIGNGNTALGMGSLQREGTNCWEKDFTHAGLFHHWGAAYDEFEGNAGNFTVAIVEMANGTIQEVLPKNLKFVDLPS